MYRRRCFCDLAFSQRCCFSVMLQSHTIKKAGKGDKPLTWTLATGLAGNTRHSIAPLPAASWRLGTDQTPSASTQASSLPPGEAQLPLTKHTQPHLQLLAFKGSTFQHLRSAVPTTHVTHAEPDYVLPKPQHHHAHLSKKVDFYVFFKPDPNANH